MSKNGYPVVLLASFKNWRGGQDDCWNTAPRATLKKQAMMSKRVASRLLSGLLPREGSGTEARLTLP